MNLVDVINNLSTKEREKAIEALMTDKRTPCEKLGHKYRVVSHEMFWFAPPKTRVFCERCGTIRIT